MLWTKQLQETRRAWLKGRIGIVEKYLNKVKIVEPCYSTISETPILTDALLTVCIVSYMTVAIKIEISDIIESQSSTIFTLFKYFFHDPYSPYKQFFNYSHNICELVKE